MDDVVRNVAVQISEATATPQVKSFFDEATFTVSYVVHDPATRCAAVIDSVLDYDAASGRTSFASADAIIAYIRDQKLAVEWLLETHAHADHFSAASYIRQAVGGTLAMGRAIRQIQELFAKTFNLNNSFASDGSQFDRLFDDGECFCIGNLPVTVLCVPGHTPADVTYVIGNAAFVGDTMFMPDYGTARTDFPGGDARILFRSIRRLLSLPGETRLFLCHDYKAPGRDEFRWETTVAEQRSANIHVRDGSDEDSFVKMRNARDRTLPMPKLILPSIQVNIRAGQFPDPDDNGISYLRIPLNTI